MVLSGSYDDDDDDDDDEESDDSGLPPAFGGFCILKF